VFCILLCSILIILAINVFRNLNSPRSIVSPPKNVYYQRPKINKTINKSPDKTKYLIRKKPGYIEQSPQKKKYPTKFRISSLLT